jgi:tetratricopeptide (TPR) repeat protein
MHHQKLLLLGNPNMTAIAMELTESTYDEIKAFCAKGDELASQKKYSAALEQYNCAWALIPEPKNEWEASTWVLAAIGDVCFLGGFMISAREALQYAMTCPGALGNPFIHLRYGQVLFDAGEMDVAANELTRAYMGAGSEIFAKEDQKYFDFLKTKIVI